MAATGLNIALMAGGKFHERIALANDTDSRWDHLPLEQGIRFQNYDVWTSVGFGEAIPDQGWKIHVSSIAARGQSTLSIVATLCYKYRTDFKYLRSRKMLEVMNGKSAHRSSSGKFIAIYPRTVQESVELLDRISEALHGFPGPYVLNDLSWSDRSPVYTRYGGYARILTQDTEVPTLAIRTPDGALIPDRRDPAVSIPEFVVVHPRIAARRKEIAEKSHVEASFRIHEALQFSNSGGVYRGALKSGTPCVIKEARPWTGYYGSSPDSVELLHHEYRMLQRCGDVPEVVGVYGIERLWQHWYLIEEFIEGRTLAEAMFERRAYLSPADYRLWAEQTLKKVEAAFARIHEVGIVVGDVHLRNIIITPKGDVRIIDFEAAFESDQQRTFIIGAPGFRSHKQGYEADRHALAALSIRLYNDLPSLASLDPSALIRASDLAQRMYAVDHHRLDAAVETLGGISADRYEVTDQRVRQFIADHATPNRRDLLFPGSSHSTSGDRGTNFLDGAGGVLWAWRTSGVEPACEWIDWLAERSWDVREQRALGFDGTLGAATALDLVGHPGAKRLIEHATSRLEILSSSTLSTGITGALIAYLGFYSRFASPEYLQVLKYLVERSYSLGFAEQPGNPEFLTALAGVMLINPTWVPINSLIASLKEILGKREEEFGLSRFRGLSLLSLTADQVAIASPREGEEIRERVKELARTCRTDSRSIFNGIGAALLTLSDSRDPSDAEICASFREQLHARVVQTDEYDAVPGDELQRLSCDVDAGSASLLVVHASLNSSTNRLAEVFAPQILEARKSEATESSFVSAN